MNDNEISLYREETEEMNKELRIADSVESAVAHHTPTYIVDESTDIDSDDPYKGARRLLTETESPEQFSVARQMVKFLKDNKPKVKETDDMIQKLMNRKLILMTNLSTTHQQLAHLAQTYDLSEILPSELQDLPQQKKLGVSDVESQ